MANLADPARRAALSLLTGVLGDGKRLSEALAGLPAALAPADRARAQRLATGTLRWMDRADRALGPFLRVKPRPRVHNALRLALFEVMVAGEAEHGAVNDAVSLVRESPETAPQAGLANAVLRNVLRQGPPVWEALPLPRLPKWLRKPLISQYGKPDVAAMEAVFAAPPPLDLTPRASSEAASLATGLGGAVLPTGSVRLVAPGQITALPGYAAGAWWVQDAAAAMPVRILDPQPGEAVVDLCAAPGGKTLQAAAAGARVSAVDLSQKRLERLGRNLQRCGLSAEVVAADALDWRPAEPCDAVLLDAPCSATGTLRRHPDLPRVRDGSGLGPLVTLQAALLDAALEMLRPGGRLVYCTCSLLAVEGEDQLAAALERHPTLRVDPAALARPGVAEGWHAPGGGLRLRPDFWPELGGMDGFFIAALRKGDTAAR